MDYLTVKFIHVLSSVALVGTGFGTAFYLFFANRSGSVAAQAVVSHWVVKADTWFTTPAVIVQPLSGFYMVYLAGFPLTTPWLMWAIGLYLLAGACWLPVVWLQLKLRDMAHIAHSQGTSLPALYSQYARLWEILGYPAFLAMVGVFYLMVVKPSF
jgi:uncharacterized membrane protein